MILKRHISSIFDRWTQSFSRVNNHHFENVSGILGPLGQYEVGLVKGTLGCPTLEFGVE
jgi:hypothetical protein